MSFIRHKILDPALAEKDRQECLKRVFADPGIPDDLRTTSSFWIENSKSPLADVQSEILADETDIVIIGSGITGTSVAYTLLESTSVSNDAVCGASQQKPRIVMLDARGVCSGATGRNGGHCLETVEDYLHLKDSYGVAAAVKITKFKLAHMQRMLEIAKRFGIVEEAQVRRIQFLSTYSNDEAWQEAKEVIAAFKNDMPKEGEDFGFIEGPEVLQEYYLPSAIGAVYGPAGAIWPYRFVTSILAKLRELHKSHFAIETHTAAHDIKEEDGSYVVKTSRGLIRTKHIIHCTNGHVCHLVPGLSGKLFPVRGQMSAQEPLRGVPNQSHKHSWLINYENGFDYLTQLPHGADGSHGEMMLGGGFGKTHGHGVAEIGIAHDSELNIDAQTHLEHGLKLAFGHYADHPRHKSRVKMMWTGTMGFSIDGLPWVGRLPELLTRTNSTAARKVFGMEGKGGEWIAAGFSGEGMVNAWLCGEALAKMILSEDTNQPAEFEKVMSWFPEQMLLTQERLNSVGLPVPTSRSQMVLEMAPRTAML